jgi:uncharacterized protein YjiS (DUF1127 family)
MLVFIAAKIHTYLRRRATARALSELSDRALHDIGLTRSGIDGAARNAR